MHTQYQKNKGFTLLEIIAVLVIAAVATLVVANTVSRGRSNLAGRTEALKSHIRYAQSMAMSTDEQNWGIRFDTTENQYWLFYCPTAQTSGVNIVSIPGAEPGPGDKVDLDDANIDIIGINPGGTEVTLAFNNFGTPYYGDLNQVLGNLLASEMTITLADPAGNTETANVTPTTGFVP
ncbi:MAG: type II secretion system GspH family protein [Desulfobacteraceae bacterium]|nr:type II secretion system GspH family protein [Desulfobacteraceae bacterium]MCF8035631.1 type II secretion system GspH family protein [Desulfobacteraceae bacterium]